MTLHLAVSASRPGTGATHVAANLAGLLAQEGQRVGLIDADFEAPSLHFLFDITPEKMHGSVTDFLAGHGELSDAAIRLRRDPAGVVSAWDQVGGQEEDAGADPFPLYFVPLTSDPYLAPRPRFSDQDFERLDGGIQRLVDRLQLDILVLDTSAGFGRETLLTLALCDRLLVVLTLDRQAVQGSSILVDIADKLHIRRTQVVVNKVPAGYDLRNVQQWVSQSYGCHAAAILPYADEIAVLESRDLFSQRYPEHPATEQLRRLAHAIVIAA